MEDKINETVKFHRLDRSMGESLSTFYSVVEAEQKTSGPQKKSLLTEKEKSASRSKSNRGFTKPSRNIKELKVIT